MKTQCMWKKKMPTLHLILYMHPRGGSRGAPSLKLKKIWFFGIKSWFFTRNTPKFFAPHSARRNFFKCAPPNLKSWIHPFIWYCTCILHCWSASSDAVHTSINVDLLHLILYMHPSMLICHLLFHLMLKKSKLFILCCSN